MMSKRFWCEIMSKQKKTVNDINWEKIFQKYDVLDHITSNGEFRILAKQIKEFREPRLMAKADNHESLPNIFKDNKLGILPISRSEYLISSFNLYNEIQKINSEIKQVIFPSYIQSLDAKSLTSETMAINVAMAAGVFEDFLSEEGLVPTVSGRMSTGAFSFTIKSNNGVFSHHISVNNSQIEIDAAFEGFDSLTLVEAKLYTAPDFLIRQLYYPFRTWVNRLRKKVRTIFVVFSNGIFNLYEYHFTDPSDYNSISLIKSMRYSIDDTRITIEDIEKIANELEPVNEPRVPFPQADRFDRVIDLCTNLFNQDKSLEKISWEYGFDIRQAHYYSNAATYLGLVEKNTDTGSALFSLTKSGKRIFSLNYKDRQLALCNRILEHKVFIEVYRLTLQKTPTIQEIVSIMKSNYIFNVRREETYMRRAQTIRSWINWIFSLVEP